MEIIGSIKRNIFISSILKLLLLSAVIHFVLLITKFITTGNFNLINYLKIIGIDLFFPKLTNNLISFLIGGSIFIGIYIYFLIREIFKVID